MYTTGMHTMTWLSDCASHTRMMRESPLTIRVPPACFQSVTTPLPRLTCSTSFSPRNALTICTGPLLSDES